MADSNIITAAHLRECFAGTELPSDPLDVEMPAGSDRWPEDMRRHLTESIQPAGVLVPVVERESAELTLLLTQRSADLKHHPGQISFPGGRMEAHDADIVQTALRETHEEVGIRQADIAVIGFLNPMPTITGFAVTPIVGLIDPEYELNIDETEVEFAFEVPLSFLLDPANRRLVEREFFGNKAQIMEFQYGEHRIWGATAFIILQFIKYISK